MKNYLKLMVNIVYVRFLQFIRFQIKCHGRNSRNLDDYFRGFVIPFCTVIPTVNLLSILKQNILQTFWCKYYALYNFSNKIKLRIKVETDYYCQNWHFYSTKYHCGDLFNAWKLRKFSLVCYFFGSLAPNL